MGRHRGNAGRRFSSGATTPRVYFGKGLGDLDIGYLRPLAVAGLVGYQIADSPPRSNLFTAGFVVEYSIPYLRSKVQSLDLPEFVRGLTPMTEVLFTIPAGRASGARTTALIAPGLSYAGAGWEFAIEGLCRRAGDRQGIALSRSSTCRSISSPPRRSADRCFPPP